MGREDNTASTGESAILILRQHDSIFASNDMKRHHEPLGNEEKGPNN